MIFFYEKMFTIKWTQLSFIHLLKKKKDCQKVQNKNPFQRLNKINLIDIQNKILDAT